MTIAVSNSRKPGDSFGARAALSAPPISASVLDQDIARLISCRFGSDLLPDTPEGRDFLWLIAEDRAARTQNPEYVLRLLNERAGRWLHPWEAVAQAHILCLDHTPRTPEELAIALKLTREEWRYIKPKTLPEPHGVDQPVPPTLASRKRRGRSAKPWP
jgi:hypothetical protein